MNKYAIVKNGTVQSVFHSEQEASAFPDLAGFIYQVDESVDCNWTYDGVTWTAPSTAVRTIGTYDFFQRFTLDERKAIYVAASQNPEMQDWVNLAMANTKVFLDDPIVTNAMNALVGAGLVTSDRRAVILS